MKLITTISLVAALMVPASSVTAVEIRTSEDCNVSSAPVVVKSLTDYPGRVRTVTETQKAEIRAVSERLYGNTKFICTGARVAYNPYGINISVRMRAKLVCEYAKSLRPDLNYWYQAKVTNHQSFN